MVLPLPALSHPLPLLDFIQIDIKKVNYFFAFFSFVFFSSGEDRGARGREGEEAGHCSVETRGESERPVERRVYVGRPGAVASEGGRDEA